MKPTFNTTIATGHYETSRAAQIILEAGGNAFDATIAAALAATVAEPSLCSLGGGGFLLAQTAAGQNLLVDCFVNVPGKQRGTQNSWPSSQTAVMARFSGQEQTFFVGPATVAVPGLLPGLQHIQQKLATMPLQTLIEPAETLARQGVVLNPFQAYMLQLFEPIYLYTEASRALFAPNGKLIDHQRLFKNIALADLLSALGHDYKNAYDDLIVTRLIELMEAELPGTWSRSDLDDYTVIERQPLIGHYRHYQLLTNPPPAQGGMSLLLALAWLERQMASKSPWQHPKHLESLREAIAQSAPRLDVNSDLPPQSARGTTQITIADKYGNCCSLSLSNGEGSGYLIPGTGVMLNNMIGEEELCPQGWQSYSPGRRIGSMMAPTLVLENRQPILACGSGGSKRIRSALLQVISNFLDYQQPLSAAIAAPRLHWDDKEIELEPGFPQESVAALRLNHTVNLWRESSPYFGGVHAVRPFQEAAADHRRLGDARLLNL